MRTGGSSNCKFGENCTFAYNQLEIDVWTMERNGKLDRSLLFETAATKLDPVNRITRLLQDYQGVFVFLCQVSGASLCRKKHASVVVHISQSVVCQTIYTSPLIIYVTHNWSCFVWVLLTLQTCFDGKPRIISRRYKDGQTICSQARHRFDANKWALHLCHPPFLSLLPWTFVIYLLPCAHKVFGVWGEGLQCEQGPPIQHPVSLGFVRTNQPFEQPERGRLSLCPLYHWAQDLDGAAAHRWGQAGNTTILTRSRRYLASAHTKMLSGVVCSSVSVFAFTGISHDDIVKVSTKYYDKHEQPFNRDEGNKVRNLSAVI